MRILSYSVIAFLVLSVSGRADEAPPATPPASFVDSDVVKDWSGNIALGLSVTQGNSKTLAANGAFAIEKLWKTDEWRAGVDGQYGVNNFSTKSNEVINAENIHGFLDYKHLFNDRFYGNGRADFWHDYV